MEKDWRRTKNEGVLQKRTEQKQQDGDCKIPN